MQQVLGEGSGLETEGWVGGWGSPGTHLGSWGGYHQQLTPAVFLTEAPGLWPSESDVAQHLTAPNTTSE